MPRRLRMKNSSGHIKEDIEKMEASLEDIRLWMRKKKLKMNEKKTEVLVVTSKAKKKYVDGVKVKIVNDYIAPSASLKNLGGWFDQNMSMHDQVK